MPAILVPVGLLASNPWIVLFFVFVAFYCIMLYFLEYIDNKFSLGHRGSFLFTLWLLIAFVFFILVVLFHTSAVIVMLLDILLIPVVLLWLFPPYQHISGLVRGNTDVLRILLGIGAVILILFVSFTSTDGFGLLAGKSATTVPAAGFEMRITESGGVPYKIMGASGINASVSEAVVDNGDWSVRLIFTDEGERVYRDAMLNRQPVSLSLIVDGETIISRPLTANEAGVSKTVRLNALRVFVGKGTEGQEKATRILDSLKK